ncbi:MAG: DUF1190 domain-containing protein [Rhizobiales bacterium]|nr:DUF1190 domain-containing protein [Hyphomicrobiales bacterium]
MFPSQDICSASGVVPPADCATTWNEARKAHEAHAPTFSTQSACESEFGFGKCGPPSTAGVGAASVFIPLMAGYALSRMGTGYRAQSLYQRREDQEGQYRVSGFVTPPSTGSSGSSSSSSSGGSRWSSSSSSSNWSRSSGPTVSRTGSQSAISRGGFGSTSRSFSSSSFHSSGS